MSLLVTQEYYDSLNADANSALETAPSHRMRLLGRKRREKAAKAFIDGRLAGKSDEEIKEEIYGISPALMLFVANIIFQILLKWWESKHPKPAPIPTPTPDTGSIHE